MKEQEVKIAKETIYDQAIVVMKFGGSSVANADRICHAARIIKDYSQEARVVVVVSALQGVTDRLYGILNGIKSGRFSEAEEEVNHVAQLHMEVGSSIADVSSRCPFLASINRFRNDLLSYAQSGPLHPSDYDFIVSYGERLSPLLVAEAINSQGVRSEAVDAVEVIVTNNEYGNAKVDLELSQLKARAHLGSLLAVNVVPVVGGFYGVSKEGRVAILGRGGSDYSAAVLANVLNARKLVLWKEVDGIYSSDPKKDPFAEFLPEVSYDQAEDLARNRGAKILHPESIDPLRAKNIPIEVKNFNNLSAPGSRINGRINWVADGT